MMGIVDWKSNKNPDMAALLEVFGEVIFVGIKVVSAKGRLKYKKGSLRMKHREDSTWVKNWNGCYDLGCNAEEWGSSSYQITIHNISQI